MPEEKMGRGRDDKKDISTRDNDNTIIYWHEIICWYRIVMILEKLRSVLPLLPHSVFA